jgi:hypothetical protein
MKHPPGEAGSYVVRVEVSSGDRSDVIYRHNVDSAIALVETNWAADGRSVTMLACNTISRRIMFTYDIGDHKMLAGVANDEALADQLRRKYTIPTGVQPIEWACSVEGSQAYKRLIR